MLSAWLAKVRLAGDRPAEGELEAVPVPLRDTPCGLPEALSVRVSVPVREPAAVGVKVTFTVQLLLAARELPQLLLWAKLPEIVTELIVRLAVPLFDIVTF